VNRAGAVALGGSQRQKHEASSFPLTAHARKRPRSRSPRHVLRSQARFCFPSSRHCGVGRPHGPTRFRFRLAPGVKQRLAASAACASMRQRAARLR
jgi:hypothetical protein